PPPPLALKGENTAARAGAPGDVGRNQTKPCGFPQGDLKIEVPSGLALGPAVKENDCRLRGCVCPVVKTRDLEAVERAIADIRGGDQSRERIAAGARPASARRQLVDFGGGGWGTPDPPKGGPGRARAAAGTWDRGA